MRRALLLVTVSVTWGLVAGMWSITAGLLAGSLGVLGLGLNLLADVAGSATFSGDSDASVSIRQRLIERRRSHPWWWQQRCS